MGTVSKQQLKEIFVRVSATGNPREKMMNLIDLVNMLFGEQFVELAKNKIGFK